MAEQNELAFAPPHRLLQRALPACRHPLQILAGPPPHRPVSQLPDSMPPCQPLHTEILRMVALAMEVPHSVLTPSTQANAVPAL